MTQDEITSRRGFFKVVGQGALAAGLAPAALAEIAPGEQQGDIPRRALGKTGQKVSMLCIGGYHMGMKDEAEGIRIVHAAIDAGVNFLDNAWKYNDGRSEEYMGVALRGGKRDKVFLMTKSNKRDRKGAMKDLEDSLRRLKTDHLDLWQVHEIMGSDPEKVFAPGGSLEAFVEARKQGKTRFIGFTGHTNPKYHLEMLKHDFAWDTVQMPLNPFDPHYLSFGKLVLPELVKRKIGVIAMKTLAFGELPKTGVVTSEECWRYVWTQPVSAVCTGCDSMQALNRAVAAALAYRPMSSDEIAALLAKTRELAVQGKQESYKSARAGSCPTDPCHDRVC
jgi:predicted aldo/keto reductase-like oxidoreductase